MKIKYCCEKCGKEFQSSDECYLHEQKCIYNVSGKKAALLLEEMKDPYGQIACKHCGNHYMVYGCELSCKYERSCKKRDNYPFWKEEGKNESSN